MSISVNNLEQQYQGSLNTYLDLLKNEANKNVCMEVLRSNIGKVFTYPICRNKIINSQHIWYIHCILYKNLWYTHICGFLVYYFAIEIKCTEYKLSFTFEVNCSLVYFIKLIHKICESHSVYLCKCQIGLTKLLTGLQNFDWRISVNFDFLLQWPFVYAVLFHTCEWSCMLNATKVR